MNNFSFIDPAPDTECNIYNQAGSHNLEINLSATPLTKKTRENNSINARNFRFVPVYWGSHRMMQNGHLSFSGNGRDALTLFIPFRSILVLDRILAKEVAPALERDYKKSEHQLPDRNDDTRIEWDGETNLVKLPDIYGQTIEASWKPSVTTVVRIREAGTSPWSPGSENILFSMCTFVDLAPDTEYELKLTHKNKAGDSKPAISTVRTAPNSK